MLFLFYFTSLLLTCTCSPIDTNKLQHSTLTIDSFGRYAHLGGLFDSRTDSFLPVRDQFVEGELPLFSRLLSVERVTTVKQSIIKSSSDILENYDPDDRSKLSFLSGLIPRNKRIKFLNFTEQNTVVGNIVVKFVRDELTLNLEDKDLQDSFDDEKLNSNAFTHIVAGIKYGATMSLKFTEVNKGSGNKSVTESDMSKCLKEFSENVLGGWNGSNLTSCDSKLIEIYIEGDNAMESLWEAKDKTIDPDIQKILDTKTTSEIALSILKEIPNNVGATGYFGAFGMLMFPMEYKLMPLSSLADFGYTFKNKSIQTAGPNFQSLPKHLVNLSIDFLQEFTALENSVSKLHQVLLDYKGCLPSRLEERIQLIHSSIKAAHDDTLNEFKKLLVDARSGIASHNSLEEYISQIRRSKIQVFQQDLQSSDVKEIADKVAILKFFDSHGIKCIDSSTPLPAVFGDNLGDAFYVFVTRPGNDDFKENLVSCGETMEKLSKRTSSKSYYVDCDAGHPLCNEGNITGIFKFENGKFEAMDLVRSMEAQ